MTTVSSPVGEPTGALRPAASARVPRPTMRDVAALAGVGVKTVSRVINSEPNVSQLTIERVTRAASALNYRLDVYAGNLRRTGRRTGTIGLIVGNVANPFSGTVHRAVENIAHERGYAVFAASLDDDDDRERMIVNEFLKRRVDGLILTAISRSQAYLLPELQHGTPMVFVDREPRGIEADAVVSDNRQGAAHGTGHLLAHGHRRVAFLGDRHDIQTARQRRRGFHDEIGRAGIATSDAIVVDDLGDEQSAYLAVLDILERDSPPTALFAAQNLITIGAIRALRERGMHHRVAIVGFDDIVLGDLLDPGLTVVAQHPEAIGRLAADRLLGRMNGDDLAVATIEVPTTLIVRGSGEIPAPQP